MKLVINTNASAASTSTKNSPSTSWKGKPASKNQLNALGRSIAKLGGSASFAKQLGSLGLTAGQSQKLNNALKGDGKLTLALVKPLGFAKLADFKSVAYGNATLEMPKDSAKPKGKGRKGRKPAPATEAFASVTMADVDKAIRNIEFDVAEDEGHRAELDALKAQNEGLEKELLNLKGEMAKIVDYINNELAPAPAKKAKPSRKTKVTGRRKVTAS